MEVVVLSRGGGGGPVHGGVVMSTPPLGRPSNPCDHVPCDHVTYTMMHLVSLSPLVGQNE